MSNHKFASWFEHKLVVGPYPGEQTPSWSIMDYQVIINVSAEYYGEHKQWTRTERHWFPMSEKQNDMGMNSIFGAMVILWQAERDHKDVYLHCHSGSNRSRTVRCAYYFMRTGKQLDDPHKSGPFQNKLLANCDRHYLPARAEMEAWLRAVGEGLKTGLTRELLSISKIATINNF